MHGGVVEDVQVTGDLHMHGGVIERLVVKGDCQQYGGIVERRIIMAGGSAETQQHKEQPKIIYRDRVVYRDRIVYRDRPADPKISSLQAYNSQLSAKLRKANDEIANLNLELAKIRAAKQEPAESSEDNVLIARIEHLQSQLAKEREEWKRKVDELEWRLKAVTDIANGRNERIYEDETKGHYIGVTDDSFDVLFNLINDYPINYDNDLKEEYGISMSALKYIAKVLRLAKSPEQRREARKRLQRHGSDLIERRGGDQTKDKREKLKKTNKKQK